MLAESEVQLQEMQLDTWSSSINGTATLPSGAHKGLHIANPLPEIAATLPHRKTMECVVHTSVQNAIGGTLLNLIKQRPISSNFSSRQQYAADSGSRSKEITTAVERFIGI